jgi:hypothetical protein
MAVGDFCRGQKQTKRDTDIASRPPLHLHRLALVRRGNLGIKACEQTAHWRRTLNDCRELQCSVEFLEFLGHPHKFWDPTLGLRVWNIASRSSKRNYGKEAAAVRNWWGLREINKVGFSKVMSWRCEGNWGEDWGDEQCYTAVEWRKALTQRNEWFICDVLSFDFSWNKCFMFDSSPWETCCGNAEWVVVSLGFLTTLSVAQSIQYSIGW